MVLKPSYRYQAEVERVVDGGTIDAVIDLGFRIKTTQRLRLAGLNAAKARGAEHARGLQTKQYVRRRIRESKNQILVGTGRTSKWGRWVATVYLPDCPKSLNEELIEKRLALETKNGN
ncbi:thermonuclease family protein [Dehalococcoidia bacterium]|nr:thermonuclease family protein [Dehalococcoidia bacterium]